MFLFGIYWRNTSLVARMGVEALGRRGSMSGGGHSFLELEHSFRGLQQHAAFGLARRVAQGLDREAEPFGGHHFVGFEVDESRRAAAEGRYFVVHARKMHSVDGAQAV